MLIKWMISDIDGGMDISVTNRLRPGHVDLGLGRKTAVVLLVIVMVLSVMPARLADDDMDEDKTFGPRVPGEFPAKVGTSTDDRPTMVNSQRKLVRVDNGTLMAVWDSNGDVLLANSSDDGKTWSAPFKVADDDNVERDPAIATNGANLYIAWAEEAADRDRLVFRRYTAATDTWESPQQVYNFAGMGMDAPSIAQAGSNVYIAIDRSWPGDDWELRVLRSNNNGDNWGMTAVTNNNDEDRRPSIAAYGNQAYLTWQMDNGGDWEIWAARSMNAGASFQDFTQISTNTDPSVNPCITNNGTRVFITWEDQASGSWDIHYRYSADFLTWDPGLAMAPLNITKSQSDSRHSTVVHEDGATYVLWDDNALNAGGDIFISINSTGDFGTPMALTKGGDMLLAPNANINVTKNRVDYIYSRVFPDQPHDVLYDYYPLSANVPQLQWLGQGNYQTDGLDPEGDTTGHTYTYKVKYIDSTNSSPMPGYPKVLIDRNKDGQYQNKERYAMSAEDPNDDTYTDGKVFTFSTLITDLGTFTYRFMARNLDNAWAIGPPTADKTGPVITSYNAFPYLDWTEELGYEFDGMEPEEAMTGEDITYRIKYFDGMNEPPAAGFPKVLFDMDGDGAFDGVDDEEASMLEETAEDVTYDNGKIYTYSRSFGKVLQGGAEYHYKFIVEDMIGIYNETPAMVGPNINISTEYPVLSWVDAVGYIDDGVEPDSGSVSTEFVFKVNYTDADDEAPLGGAVEIGLDLDENNSLEPGEWVPMEEADPTDLNYSDGKTYIYKNKFASQTQYIFSFRAADINGATASGEPTGQFIVHVNVLNDPPVLKYTVEENYTSDCLDPEVGTANLTEFVYRLKFEDNDNDKPEDGYPQVGIDLDRNSSYEDDEFFTMSEVSEADDDTTDGKLYTFKHVFAEMGDYSYTFRAKDYYAWATGGPTGVFQGPSIDDEYIETAAPVLEWVDSTGYVVDGVDPNSGFNSTAFVFKVAFVDADNDPVASGEPKLLVDIDHNGLYNGSLDWSLVMMEEDPLDTDTTDGKVFYREVSIADRGEYNYTFEARSTRSSEQMFQRGLLTGTLIVLGSNSPPTLAWAGTIGFETDGIDPNTGAPAQLFNFKVKYIDPDNDPPAAGYPKAMIDLNGDGTYNQTTEVFELLPQDPGDVDFTNGKIYWKTGVAFNIEGVFKYRFIALDSKSTEATPIEGTGPKVSVPIVNQDPVLELVGVAPFLYKGVSPISGDKKTTFEFRVVYMDPEGDMPSQGYPKVILDPDSAGKETVGSTAYDMVEVDPNDINSSDGKVYKFEISLEAGDHKYAFSAVNDVNQSASLGPYDGPIVTKVTETTNGTMTREGAGDMVWILILIIAIVVGLLIGIVAGRNRRRSKVRPEELEDSEPRFRESRPLSETEEEALPEEAPEDEEASPAEDEGGYDDGGGGEEIDEDIKDDTGGE
jgi:hypothetical protein